MFGELKKMVKKILSQALYKYQVEYSDRLIVHQNAFCAASVSNRRNDTLFLAEAYAGVYILFS